MASSILSPGQEAAFSSEIVVSDDSEVLVGVYTPDGKDIPSGIALRLQIRDINGNFITASTVGFGVIVLSRAAQQFIISRPGVYRISRPDISFFEVDVGVYTD